MAFELNETLNQILIKIASGVNYASDLAKNTGKSIPVMFRQLDELIQKGILTKERNGKRVEYVIEWKSLAHSLASFIRSEFDSAKEVLSSLHIEPMSLENIEKTMESVFSTKYIQDIFQEMYQEIESAGKVSYEYTKTKFNDSVTILLETFGSVTDVEEKRILEKIPQKHAQDFSTFLDISKTHKKIKDAIDPRIQLKKKL